MDPDSTIRLRGRDGGELSLAINEAIGFPTATSYEGGYDIICTLKIKVGYYSVECDRYYSATGCLYRFQQELEQCYHSLQGTATYQMLLENDLIFSVRMKKGGHAVIKGNYQERPDIENRLNFEMETDQTCLLEVIRKIEQVKEKYGGMEGKTRR